MGSIPRRQFLIVGGALLGAPFARVLAQAPRTSAEVRRIGMLMPGPFPPYTDPMVAALRELGWNVGKNLIIESRYTQGDLERIETFARELEAQGVALSTVRTQINSIRAKTGAASIRALVRQVAVLPPLVSALRGNTSLH